MTDPRKHGPYPSARVATEEAARVQKETPQTRSPTYRLAFDDLDLMLREELRPTRVQLELTKADLILRDHGIASTVAVFGSSRTPSPDRMKSPGGDAADEAFARKVADYEEARRFARLISERSADNHRECVIVTGGGPGIMEAANRGAEEAGAPSIGFNIVLPYEQAPNRHITPELSFQFHYFAARKMHFLMRARALVCFPGGFGTMDELFETLTLIQTGKVDPFPVLLFREAWWRRMVNFDAMVEDGMIDPADLEIFRFVESAEDAIEAIAAFGRPASSSDP